MNVDPKYASEPDSGYGSAVFNTPASERPKVSGGTETNAIPFKLSPESISTKNDKPVGKETISRFNEVVERIEEQLVSYVQKSRSKHYPITVRLAVTGEEEDTKPWIVVFCHVKQAKRVRRFFGKQFAKEICQPQDPSLPSFEVHVHSRAPQLRTALHDIDVYNGKCPLDTGRSEVTLCGTPIKFAKGEQARIATLGGIIKLTSPDGEYVLYGMTAGHAAEDLEDDMDDDESDYISSEDEEEVQDNNLGNRKTTAALTLDPSPMRNPSEALPSTLMLPDQWEALKSTLVCSVEDPSPTELEREKNFDWALVNFGDHSAIKPNTLGAVGSEKARWNDLKVASTILEYPMTPSVIMISGLQGPKHGTLSALPSKLLSGSGQKFVNTYILTLNENDGTNCPRREMGFG
jgi:hypothetical protein